MYSEHADPIAKLKDAGPNRRAPVWGVCVHTTGSGIVEKALKAKADPFEYAVAYYARPDSFWAHYVIAHDGRIAAISSEEERALHIGLSKEERAAYRSGAWKKMVSKETARLWDSRWIGHDSPNSLWEDEAPTPNDAYIGVELLPLVKGISAKPMYAGLSFTEAQHDSVRNLIDDVLVRYRLVEVLTSTTRQMRRISGQIVGHEDVNPITRSDTGGGWDPGALRAAYKFDWSYVLR